MMYFMLFMYFIYIIIKSKKNFHMLQQNFYNNSNRFLKWLKNNPFKTLFTFDWLFLVFIIISLFYNKLDLYFCIFYLVIGIYYFYKYSHEQSKIKFKITSRVKRMFITEFILSVGIVFLFMNVDRIYGYMILGLYASLNSIIIYLVNIINKPIEKIVYYYYFNKAKKKVRENPRLKVIGITGSYGKTSSKNILSDILKVKYDCLPTPKNFNTPYGLMLTINNYMDKFNEFLIAEMGACEVGQIKELCNFVHPTYGIITKIGVAHLDSFKSEENIQKTKFELIESLPEDGIGILNKDDEKQVDYVENKLKNKCKILWVGIDNKDADIVASDIIGTPNGMSFDIKFKDDKKKYKVETKLLGKANVYNILSACLLAYNLGMNIDEIISGVSRINTIEHRLEMKKLGTLNIIDDAYNSNPVGSKMALDTLSIMPGMKIVVTPGMIELKDKQYDLNYKFGEYISDVADVVILVGKKQTKPIQDALKKKNYNDKNLYIIDDVMEAFKIINNIKEKDTYVLLENDLPDLFNE